MDARMTQEYFLRISEAAKRGSGYVAEGDCITAENELCRIEEIVSKLHNEFMSIRKQLHA